VLQNHPCGIGRMDRRQNPQTAAAVDAFEHVEGEDPAQELGPGVVARRPERGRTGSAWRGRYGLPGHSRYRGGRALRVPWRSARRAAASRCIDHSGHDRRSPRRARREHSVVAHQVESREELGSYTYLIREDNGA
jgi:hypothetical protein